MANIKISEMTAAGGLTGDELIEGVQDGESVAMTAQAIADLASPGAVDTLYTADGELSAYRTVTIPAGGGISLQLDGSNAFQVGDDGGFFVYFQVGGGQVFSASANSFQITPDLFTQNGIYSSGPITGRKSISEITADGELSGYSGTVFVNTGAGATITVILPDSDPGTVYTITSDAGEAQTIYFNTAVGISATVGSAAVTVTDSVLGYIDIGASVTFLKISATQWMATSVVGNVGLD